MTILVTGAAGFVGGHLVNRLARRGGAILALDAAPPTAAWRRFLGPWAAQVTWGRGDVRRRDEMVALMAANGVEAVVHAAALTSPPATAAERSQFVDVNLRGTVNVLAAARKLGVRRFLFVSSDAVYGSTAVDRVLTEETAVAGAHLYALCKRAGERLCQRYAARYGLEAVVARLGTVYGPLERATAARPRPSLPFTLAQHALTGAPLPVYGVERRRSYCYVADAAEGLAALLLAPRHPWTVYNVGSATSVPLRRLLETLVRVSPGFQWRTAADEAAATVVMTAAQERSALDVTRLQAAVGWTPQTSLATGLRATCGWLRDTVNFV